MSDPPSVAHTHGKIVHYNYDEGQWDALQRADPNSLYYDQSNECSHFVYKITCQNKAYHHWPNGKPYVKENYPKKCRGVCRCPVDGQGFFVKRTGLRRAHRNNEFGPPEPWIPSSPCKKCDAFKRKRAGTDIEEGKPSGKKRPGDPDPSAGKRSKTAHTINERGRTVYDPTKDI